MPFKASRAKPDACSGVRVKDAFSVVMVGTVGLRVSSSRQAQSTAPVAKPNTASNRFMAPSPDTVEHSPS
jgi:hypothetical protein